MDIGKLNKKIAIKAVNPTTDGQGGATEGTPTTSATVWGNVKPMDAKQSLDYGELVGHKLYVITLNFRDDITIDNTSLLTYDSRDMTVHSVIDKNEESKQLKLVGYEKK